MDSFKTVDHALDFAIGEEEAAQAFYDDLASRVTQPGVKEVLLQFAEEERGHKLKLLDIKSGQKLLSAEKEVTDLKIGDYLVEADATGDVEYQEALIIAMKKEKAAYVMYTNLAAATPDPGVRDVFLGLSREEANHKLRFEMEYDTEVMREN